MKPLSYAEYIRSRGERWEHLRYEYVIAGVKGVAKTKTIEGGGDDH